MICVCKSIKTTKLVQASTSLFVVRHVGTARLVTLDTLVSIARHVESVESCRDVTWRAKWNLGLDDY